MWDKRPKYAAKFAKKKKAAAEGDDAEMEENKAAE